MRDTPILANRDVPCQIKRPLAPKWIEGPALYFAFSRRLAIRGMQTKTRMVHPRIIPPISGEKLPFLRLALNRATIIQGANITTKPEMQRKNFFMDFIPPDRVVWQYV